MHLPASDAKRRDQIKFVLCVKPNNNVVNGSSVSGPRRHDGAGTYNWGNNALMRFNETIKDALDPNGILAPGRNGIWPKRLRGNGWEITGAEVEDSLDGKRLGPK